MNINISFTGLDSSEALKKYVTEKIEKHSIILNEVSSIEVFFKSNIAARGVDKDFKLDINLHLPRAIIRVEEYGSDMYAVIDIATDVLIRRLKRYHEKKSSWEGNTPWRVLEADEALEEGLSNDEKEDSLIDPYASYIPKISVRRKMEDMHPMDEGEAIEKMELMGRKQILFKNKATGKISMIYSHDDGSYVLVEPEDTLEV